MTKISRIKGFNDLLDDDALKFVFLSEQARKIFRLYNFKEIFTPIVEKTELFSRGIGDLTDIVQKEMYTFSDRKNRSITLRPEATAGVVRAYVENFTSSQNSLVKLFSIGPMFRYERPQKGRLRQFNQINVESFGSESFLLDIEIILMLNAFFRSININNFSFKFNFLGCKHCRPSYLIQLYKFFENIDSSLLCSDCQIRMKQNPLRVLDCKVSSCKELINNSPDINNYICDDCKSHKFNLLSFLDSLNFTYLIDSNLVRGLDYYSRTIFEVISNEVGSQSAIAGGGRYNELVSQLGGPDTPGIGFAIGMERLCLLMRDYNASESKVYIFTADNKFSNQIFNIASVLRNSNFTVEIGILDRSLKSHLRFANKEKFKFCIIIDNNINNNQVNIKNLSTSTQVLIHVDQLTNYLNTEGA